MTHVPANPMLSPVDRRTATAGLAAILALPAYRRGAARLPQPDPAQWHVDTVPAARFVADGPNGAVAGRVYGQAGRIPVIALHGGPAAGERYMRPYAGLATDRQVVLYDQSGCGASARPADFSRYTLARYVAEVEAVRAQLGFDRVALVGHSWGGMLAPAYAAAYPHRVAALVVAGSAPRWRDFALAAWRWLTALGPDALATVAAAESSGRTDDPRYAALIARYYALHLCRLDPWPAFLIDAGQAIAQNPVYAYLNGPSEFQFTGAFADLDVRAALRALRLPTLVTCGEYDEAPPWVGAQTQALVRGSILQAFAGLSHMAHIEDPARVVGVTSAFLRRHA